MTTSRGKSKRQGTKPGVRAAETIRFAAVEPAGTPGQRFASLLVVQGAEADLGRLVRCDRPITIGRDDGVELALRDGSTSRRHCVVERDDESGRYLLRDLGSTNGTLVNGSRVSGAVPLADNDKIQLGATIIRFGTTDDVDASYLQRVERLAGTDALTGLLSLPKFDSEFALACDEARRVGASLGVLVMDMDGLKRINDTHGHDMGGFAIREVATLIRAQLDAGGAKHFTCRFGGDEFIAVLPGVDKTATAHLGEVIRDAVATHVFEKDGVRVAPTISIGVACFPDDGEMPEDLFRAADRALYRAKAAGRNQVSL